jgi:hypothetical protein
MGFERTEEAIETRQFDWISMPHNRSDEDSLFFDKKLIIKAVGRDTNRLYFVLGNDIRTLDLRYFTHQIKKYVPDFTSSMTIPNEGMSFVFEAPGYRAKIVFESINLNCSTNDTAVVDYRYRLLVKRK